MIEVLKLFEWKELQVIEIELITLSITLSCKVWIHQKQIPI